MQPSFPNLPCLCRTLFLVSLLLFSFGIFAQESEQQEQGALPQVEGPTTVILVRHAEKMAPKGDPDLSPDGRERAATLAHVLTDVAIDAVYATPYKRTRQTAEPLAELLDLEVRVAEVRPSYEREMVGLIDEHHQGQTIVAISHSNTVPDLIDALGISPAPKIEDHQYDQLFIVTLLPNRPPHLLQLQYGKATP